MTPANQDKHLNFSSNKLLSVIIGSVESASLLILWLFNCYCLCFLFESGYGTDSNICIDAPSLIMSHSLLRRHIVLLTVGVYSSNHRVLYTIGISMTRRFQKSVGPSVRPSVRLSVCNANKKNLLLLHY